MTAQKLQGAAFERHKKEGGLNASTWKVVGIGLTSLVSILAALVILSILFLESAFFET